MSSSSAGEFFLRRLEAAFGMNVLQHLLHAADAHAPRVVAAGGVFVQRDFRPIADELRLLGLLRPGAGQCPDLFIAGVCVLMALLGQAADQFPTGFVAIGGMLMLRGFLHAADQRPRFVITGGRMLMARRLLKAADQILVFFITARVMGVGRLLRFGADQVPPLQRITAFVMDVHLLGRGVTAGAVGMFPNFRQRTPELSFRVVTGIVVRMHHEIGFAAHRIAFFVKAVRRVPVQIQTFQRADGRKRRILLHLGPTGLGMGMLRNRTAGFFQGYCRQNQRVGGAEHRNRGQHAHDFPPEMAAAPAGGIARRFLHHAIVHFGIPLFI